MKKKIYFLYFKCLLYTCYDLHILLFYIEMVVKYLYKNP